MQLGDQVLFYHSVTNPCVVGLATVVRESYPDPTEVVAMSKDGVTPKPAQWVVVELEPVLSLENPVSLAQIKAEPLLANMALVRHSRLSVMPLTVDEFELILAMGQKPVGKE